jgi:hypothetical protein
MDFLVAVDKNGNEYTQSTPFVAPGQTSMNWNMLCGTLVPD